MDWIILLDSSKTDYEYISYIRNKLSWQIDANNLQDKVSVEDIDPKYYFFARYISIIDSYIDISEDFVSVIYREVQSCSEDCIELKGIIDTDNGSYAFNNTSKTGNQIVLPVTRLNPTVNRVILSNFDYYLGNNDISAIVQTIRRVNILLLVYLKKSINSGSNISIYNQTRKSKEKVLVIIPAYNAELTIAESIESVLDQTHKDIILVVVNDCSTNSTAKIIREYSSVVLYNLPKNVGTYTAINHALYRIKDYDYFMIHGADDVLYRDNVEKHLSKLVGTKYLASVSGYIRCYYGSNLVEKQAIFGDSMYMYSKKVFERMGYYDSVRFGGDSEYAARFLKCFGESRVIGIGEILTKAYIMPHNTNLTSKIPLAGNTRDNYVQKFIAEHSEMSNNKNFLRKAFDDTFISMNVASVPSRELILRRTIESVINQCDIVNVFLNNYEHIPDYLLNNVKINVWKSQDYRDKGDAGKFFKSGETNGYFFTIDDDLEYPSDYVTTMISKVEEYKRKFIITCHGRTLIPGKIQSYYSAASRLYQYHCLKEQKEDQVVEVGGTGVMCFHSDTIKVTFGDFLEPNMADIWMFKLSQEQKVGIISIAHSASWLQYLKGVNDQDTIYSQHHNKDSIQTGVINSFANRFTPTIPKYKNLTPYLLGTNKELPLVSIIIPYNKDRGYLAQAIESVENQTYENIELILSNSDDTVGVNINNGIRVSSGIYIKYLSEDDILPENSIKDSVNALLFRDFDFIHGNCENFFDDGSVELHIPSVINPNKDNLIENNVLHGGSLMYHKRVFEKYGLFDEDLWTAEEFEFNLRILSQGAKIGYCNNVLYRYRRHESQKSIATGALDTKYQIKRIEVKEAIKNKYR